MATKITRKLFDSLNTKMFWLYLNCGSVIDLNYDIYEILNKMNNMIFKIAKKCDCLDFEILND